MGNIETKFDSFINEGWMKKLIDPTGELFSKKDIAVGGDKSPWDRYLKYGKSGPEFKARDRVFCSMVPKEIDVRHPEPFSVDAMAVRKRNKRWVKGVVVSHHLGGYLICYDDYNKQATRDESILDQAPYSVHLELRGHFGLFDADWIKKVEDISEEDIIYIPEDEDDEDEIRKYSSNDPYGEENWEN